MSQYKTSCYKMHYRKFSKQGNKKKPNKEKPPNKLLFSTVTEAGFIKKCPVPSLLHAPNKILHVYPFERIKNLC